MNLSSAYSKQQLSPSLKCNDVTLSLVAQCQPAKHCGEQLDACADDVDDGQTVGYATSLRSPDRDSDVMDNATTYRQAFPLVAGMSASWRDPASVAPLKQFDLMGFVPADCNK